jgi:hypothetical protein
MDLVGEILYSDAAHLGVAHPYSAPTILDGGVDKFTTGEVAEQVIGGFLRAAATDKALRDAGASPASPLPPSPTSPERRTPRIPARGSKRLSPPLRANRESRLAKLAHVLKVFGLDDVCSGVFGQHRFQIWRVRVEGVEIDTDAVSKAAAASARSHPIPSDRPAPDARRCPLRIRSRRVLQHQIFDSIFV